MKQHFSITIEMKEITFKGWNWGATDFQGVSTTLRVGPPFNCSRSGPDLAFLVSNRTSFELPLQSVANSNIAGKTEVSLEFTSTPDIKGGKKAKPPDELVEMRFYIPGTHTKEGSENKGSDDEDEIEMSAAQAFHDTIKEKAEIGKVIGETLVSFDEVLVTTPRGRYDVDMFPTFLRLRGKTYDYKVLYSSIIRLFLLPKFDENHIQFIVGFSLYVLCHNVSATRTGRSRPSDSTRSNKISLSCHAFQQRRGTRFRAEHRPVSAGRTEGPVSDMLSSETFERDYKGKLEQKYESPTFTVVSEVFKGLTGKKITAASSSYERWVKLC
jgi:FACT complex subunit SSRP1/POB3